jgi:hypothetical protein
MKPTPCFTLLLALAGPTLGPTIGRAQAAPTFVRIQHNTVELLDLPAATWRLIHRGTRDAISDLGVSPAGDRIALLSWTRGTVSGHDYSTMPAVRLVVIDTLGRTLASVPGVHRYSWCGSDCVVYLLGEYSEDSDFGFRPSGDVGVLQVSSRKTTSLRAPPYPVSVTWAPPDSGAYVKGFTPTGQPRIYRIDLATREPSLTGLRDNDLSPNGRYYLYRPPESDSVGVYDTRGNAPVDISPLLRNADVIGWAGPAGDVLLAVQHVLRVLPQADDPRAIRPIRPEDIRPQQYLLYRVSDGRILAHATGLLHQWAGPAQRRLIRQGGKYMVLESR